jgi:hypothetical protein
MRHYEARCRKVDTNDHYPSALVYYICQEDSLFEQYIDACPAYLCSDPCGELTW